MGGIFRKRGLAVSGSTSGFIEPFAFEVGILSIRLEIHNQKYTTPIRATLGRYIIPVIILFLTNVTKALSDGKYIFRKVHCTYLVIMKI